VQERRVIRSQFVASLISGLVSPKTVKVPDGFETIERRWGGIIGVYAIDLDSGRTLEHRAAQRFPLASTQKLPLVMAALDRVDRGRDRLDAPVRILKNDLEPPYSDIAQKYPQGTTLSLASVCEYAISNSDNTAADVLCRRIGGPAAVTAYLRQLGVSDVRVDRYERDLHSPASLTEPRDTGTPHAMAYLVVRLVTRPALSQRSTLLLLAWMHEVVTGDARLRAGVPPGWSVADKTGSYQNASNDIGLLVPPHGKPIAIACYAFGNHGNLGGSHAIADAARLAIRTLRG
jgi:beta-lactamase class A